MKKSSIILFTLIVTFSSYSIAFADVFSAGEALVGDVQSFLLKISTAGAAIGVASGGFMRYFSMGNPQKIEMGNKVMGGSLIAWTVINGVPLILSTIQSYI